MRPDFVEIDHQKLNKSGIAHLVFRWWPVGNQVLLSIELELVNKNPCQVTFLWFANSRIFANTIHLIFNGKSQRLVGLFDKQPERRFVVSIQGLILAHY